MIGPNLPPVIYSGAIERVDFGEVKDDKFFVVADMEKGKAEMDWRKLKEIQGIRLWIEIGEMDLDELEDQLDWIIENGLAIVDKLLAEEKPDQH